MHNAWPLKNIDIRPAGEIRRPGGFASAADAAAACTEKIDAVSLKKKPNKETEQTRDTSRFFFCFDLAPFHRNHLHTCMQSSHNDPLDVRWMSNVQGMTYGYLLDEVCYLRTFKVKDVLESKDFNWKDQTAIKLNWKLLLRFR